MGDTKAQVFDTLFGTRYHTPGASLQLPRKVPMRVEPKSYFGGCCGLAWLHQLLPQQQARPPEHLATLAAY
jgi:hypothetical protein